MMTGPDRDDAAHEAREALRGPAHPPTEEILIAVEAGLAKVPAGANNEWYEVPGQRLTPQAGPLPGRHRA
jgi:hypothetical protein